MTPGEKNKFKVLLHDEIEKTKKEMILLVDMTKPISPENSIGRISRMDAINNKSVNEAALRDKKNKLALLESALDKIVKKILVSVLNVVFPSPWADYLLCLMRQNV